jgi:hypothetical protein
MKKKSQTNKQNNHKRNKNNNKKNNNQKKHNRVKSKRKQTGGGTQDWEAGMKDLNDMSRQDLDELKQDYQERGKSLGGAFSNFKFSVAGQNPVRPAPRPPECTIL